MVAPLDPLPFLRTLELFGDWDLVPDLSEALVELSDRCELWSFHEGDLIRFPDEGSPGPSWVVEGCLVVLEAEAPRYVGVRERVEAAPGLWVRGQTSGKFVVIPQASWSGWLRHHRAAAQRLGEEIPAPLPRGLVHSPLALEPGEVPVQVFRKAPLFLALRAALPSVFFLLFLAFGLVLQFGLDSRVSVWALWALPGLGMGITMGLLVLVTWEWSASVLAITDRSVLIRQIDVWAHRSDFEKLALERIREAILSKHGWFDAALGLVNLEIEGDSPKGRLVFRGLPQDSRFLGAMEALRKKRTASPPGRKVIRQALADRAGGARAPRLERPALKAESLGPKVGRLSWRVEKAGVLWFRRHPWFVLRRSLPWMGWTVLIAFLGLVAAVMAPGATWPIVGIALAAALVPLARIGWEIWDWADDRLSIQGDKILLVHRRPLWLGEIRQEGLLEQVQQVGVRKDSLTALVLDFGIVTVSLGAGPALVFTDAAHPEWVQNEIFYRRTLLSQDKERQSARDRLDEVSEILDTWDQARKAGYFTGNQDRDQKERP